MIAADQLVGREVSFSKSGFQFPKGAYIAYTDGIAFSSEFASGVADRHRDLLENETRPRNTGEFFVLSILFILSSRSLFWMTRRWFDAAKKLKPCLFLIFKIPSNKIFTRKTFFKMYKINQWQDSSNKIINNILIIICILATKKCVYV